MPTISGTVYDHTGAAAAGRIVRAYRRDTGVLLGQTTTGTGAVIPGDASYANVSLLLHFDGEDGSTTFTDSSSTPKSVTQFGGAQIKNTQSRFGAGSGEFSITGRGLSIASESAFDLPADFTIEFFIYKLSATGGTAVTRRQLDNVGTGSWRILTNQFQQLQSVETLLTWDEPSTGQWTHIAIARNGGSLRAFRSGVLASQVTSSFDFTSNFPIFIGADNDSARTSANAFIDELRITKGVARYTANFTPPTAPFFDYAETPAVPLGTYTLDTGVYSGEVQRIVLDDDAGTLYNDLIDRVIVA